MEKLKENSWYIRGCKGLKDYFNKNDIGLYGVCDVVGFFFEN